MMFTMVMAAAAGAMPPASIATTLMRLAEAPGTSYRSYAAPDAWLLHEGIQPATVVLASRAGPPARSWWPARTVTSCDGGLALATGTFRDADAPAKGFITIWERQGDRQWRWIFDGRTAERPTGEPVAVTAACGRLPAAQPDPLWQASGESGDGTLRWRLGRGDAEGRHHFIAEYLTKAGWKVFAEVTVS